MNVRQWKRVGRARGLVMFLVVGLLLVGCGSGARAAQPSPFRAIRDVPLSGGTSRFDYQSLDQQAHRLYIAHLGAGLVTVVDTEAGEVRAALGSAAVTARLITVPLAEAGSLPDRVVEAASPIDDVRGSAAYRRHALRVLASRALERCLRS